ncbi:MAG: hypothetical protein A4E48_01944 [Methanosaeta sp. PtaU1.Bin060]|nr:MAG: hypothetical protein A4E48_01944 [Methanosaeta sp. PtaU1.Bin060]
MRGLLPFGVRSAKPLAVYIEFTTVQKIYLKGI